MEFDPIEWLKTYRCSGRLATRCTTVRWDYLLLRIHADGPSLRQVIRHENVSSHFAWRTKRKDGECTWQGRILMTLGMPGTRPTQDPSGYLLCSSLDGRRATISCR